MSQDHIEQEILGEPKKVPKRLRLRDMLAVQIDRPTEDWPSDTLLDEKLGMDSLDVYELCCDLEAAFQVEIDDRDIADARTVGDLERMVGIRSKR